MAEPIVRRNGTVNRRAVLSTVFFQAAVWHGKRADFRSTRLRQADKSRRITGFPK